ncbi:MAG: hypothetical protein HW380_328 [Magnetococcales bacterium]|nr:hypothetical protein [Magnetococcales bacterium]
MYQAFFKLDEPPFSITPDPRFLYLGRHHREALAHLLFSVLGSSGFILLTGEVGSGKTTVSRCLIRQTLDLVDVALIFNPRLSALELVASICDELHVSYPATATLKTLYDALNQHLMQSHAKKRNTVLILDEAQNLSVDLLEQVRLLSNLETDRKKLLQIILIGQPELLVLLARPDLRQFSQRVTARYHIAPLEWTETREFIHHRLSVAGCHRPIFTPLACWLIHHTAKGIPRQINQFCDRALLGAFTLNRHRVDGWIAYAAIREVLGKTRRSVKRWQLAALILPALVLGLAFFLFIQNDRGTTTMGRPWFHSSSWLNSVQKIMDDRLAPLTEKFHGSAAISARPPKPAAASPVQTQADTQPLPVQQQPAPSIETQKVSPPPDPPVTMVLDALFRAPQEETANENAALTRLFGLWGVSQEKFDHRAICESALTMGMGCYNLTGNWNTLRQLGIPVMIKFAFFDQTLRYAVVTAIGRKNISLSFPHRDETVSLEEADRYWFGLMTVAWRMTPGKKKTLLEGMQGADIVWLRSRLAPLQKDEPTHLDSDLFDGDLMQRVRRFQAQKFMEPDGKVGMRSILALDLATQDAHRPTPRLGLLSEGGN